MTSPTPSPSPGPGSGGAGKVDVFHGVCVEGNLVAVEQKGIYPSWPVLDLVLPCYGAPT